MAVQDETRVRIGIAAVYSEKKDLLHVQLIGHRLGWRWRL
jgi:hypothetical protein